MTTDLRFTDGTTTLTSVSAADFQVVEYNPKAPNKRRTTVQHVTRDGDDLVAESWDNVAEDITIVLTSSISATFQSLNKLLLKAVVRQQTKSGTRVYLEMKETGGAVWYRSEILTGVAELDNDALDLGLTNSVVEVKVKLTRRYYWEKSSLTAIPLTNTNGTDVTTGLEIDNVHDTQGGGTTRHAVVKVNADDIVGDLPAPLVVTITNNNTGNRSKDVWIGLDYLDGDGDIWPIIEGEDSTDPGTSGSGISPATPNYAAYSEGQGWSTSNDSSSSEQKVGEWDLDDVLLTAAGGRWFKPLMRLGTTSAHSTYEVYFRMQIQIGTTTIWESGLVQHLSTWEIVDFGVVQLPPYYMEPGETALDLTMDLFVWVPGGTNWPFIIDYFFFMPMDNWRVLKSTGYHFDQNIDLVDDNAYRRTYTTGWSPTAAGRLNNYVPRGPDLMVYPDPAGASSTEVYQYFIFISEATRDDWYPNRLHDVVFEYRPRRLII